MTRVGFVLACVLGLGLGLGLEASQFGCSSDAREPVTHQVEIRAMQYVPAELAVAVGDTVVWTNSDVLPHTVTSGVPSAATFDSRSIEPKQQWRYTVKTAGELAYVCTFHPTMHGKLIAR
jgi:plastocyanin